MEYSGFSISRDSIDGRVRLFLTGELDIAGAERLKEEAAGCAEGKTVVIDTTGLTFIDSFGLGALVDVRNRLGPDRFQLVPGDALRRLLAITGTDDYLLDPTSRQEP